MCVNSFLSQKVFVNFQGRSEKKEHGKMKSKFRNFQVNEALSEAMTSVHNSLPKQITLQNWINQHPEACFCVPCGHHLGHG